MLNEVLFMEVRLIRDFCVKHNLTIKRANEIFEEKNIWKYIEDCYASLHTSGDEYILNDIEEVLKLRGAAIIS